MEIPPVSIIIPTLNEETYLPLLLGSLARIDAPMEVIVVDAHSDDRTLEVAQSFSDRFGGVSSLQVLLAPTRGVAAQRNFGAKRASHDILLFLDADVIVPSPEAYRVLISRFCARGYVVATALSRPIGIDVRASFIYATQIIFQSAMLMFGRALFSGACMLVRKETFERVGGFDTALRVAEDNEFSERAGKAGRRGLIAVRVPVSSRRLKKDGYSRTYAKWLMGGLLAVFKRSQMAQSIPYTFGEFGD